MTGLLDSEKPQTDQTMDALRLFVSLRALEAGGGDPEALRTVQDEVARLEGELATDGRAPEPFRVNAEDLDNLFLLEKRQSLEPEGKVLRIPPVRWCYRIVRKLFLGTQRQYNESVTHLVRRLYSTALLTRYYQLRALVLERRFDALEGRIADLEGKRPPETKGEE